MARTIGVLGSGDVGVSLANGFANHGYDVMIGSNSTSKFAALKEKTGGKVKVGTFVDTARHGDLLALAVKGLAAEDTIRPIDSSILAGKVVIDATNPIADAPPTNGVIRYFTGPNESLLERLQIAAPGVRFVKAFSCIGSAFMVNPQFGEVKPTMFICGDDENAKREVTVILTQFGWETEDMGKAQGARAIEPLAMLWCIPGFLRNDWSHAFALLKK